MKNAHGTPMEQSVTYGSKIPINSPVISSCSPKTAALKINSIFNE